MTTIGTLAQNNQTIQNLLNLRNQANTLETQISTGLVSQDFSGISQNASQFVDLNAQVSQQQSYLDTTNVVSTNMQLMSSALQDIQTQVGDFSSSLASGAYSTSSPTIQQQAQQLLTEVAADLNTQNGSSYLFGGADTANPPVNVTGLANQLGSQTASYYNGTGSAPSATIDTNQTLNYGITADQTVPDPSNPGQTLSPFAQIINTLNFLANYSPSGGFTAGSATDSANLATAEQQLSQGLSGLQQVQGQLALNQNTLNTAQTNLNSTISLAQTNIANIDQVDPATAITQLNTVQTQLQASYQTVSMLQQLSLVNYLK